MAVNGGPLAYPGHSGGMGVYPAPDDYFRSNALMQTHQGQGPVFVLSVSDVERLAKAGVKVEYKEIADRIQPDPPMRDGNPLLPPFLERWRRYQESKNPPERARDQFLEYGPPPFQMSVCQRGDRVYMFIVPHAENKEPQVLEDALAMWPSDALMAKIYLWMETQ